MPLSDSLSSVLRGERAATLDLEALEQLESLAHEAHAAGQAPKVRDECASRIRQGGASHGVQYLLAAACALNGEVERAHQTLLTLGNALAEEKRWPVLAAIAERALGLEETQAAARLLVRAHEGTAKDPERIEALERSWAIMPDDLELGLLLAQRLGEANEGERRRHLLAELMPGFAAERRFQGLEEAGLEFVEHHEHEGLVRLLRTLPTLAARGEFKEAAQLLNVALPELERANEAGQVHEALRMTVSAAIAAGGLAAGEPFRRGIVVSARQGPAAGAPDPQAVLDSSGLSDQDKPLLPALEVFDRVVALPPGRAVWHDSFGPGRVTRDDGETVILDFPRKADHRMPYAAARRTLSPMQEDDLRLLRLTDPKELVRLKNEEPAEMLYRALQALGGSGDAQRLKVFLVGADLVKATEWTTFWRKARAGAPKHPRIDVSRAFEQHYRVQALAVAGEPVVEVDANDAPLPPLEPRKPVKTNLATIRKFLSQHPGAERALTQRFGRFVQRAVLDDDGDLVDRARAGLLFARWFPERRDEWISVLQRLWEGGLAVTDLSGEDEQRALLEVSHEAGVEADAILSALDSRFATVRDDAERFRAMLDDAGRIELRRTLLVHAQRYPSASLRLIEEELAPRRARPGDPTVVPPDAWFVLLAALSLIEERPKPSTADKVLRMLEPGGDFERFLGSAVCPDDMKLRVRVLMMQWRSSDRFLFPALESLSRLGLAEEARHIIEVRKKKSEKLFERVGQQDESAELTVMTRATWERLQLELERLERELRTTIPATIQKARELGDLKENAEYHSAKLKQANVSKLVASLQLRLARARFVEDAEFKDGVVGLGSEVTLESDDAITSFWILGEGEQHHGEHVVSFQAPVGRALVGRRIGDEIELGEPGQKRRWRVVSIERRLPETGARTES